VSKRGYVIFGIIAAAVAGLLVFDHFDKKSGVISYQVVVPAGPENFLSIAEFRVKPNPDAARIESLARAFAAAEGLTVEEQPYRAQSSAPVSLMISVNGYTKLYIVKTGPEMPGFFSMTLQVKHSDDAPVQLALFERLKEKARAEFPDLTIEIHH